MSVGSISNLINGAGFNAYFMGGASSPPATGAAALLQMLQVSNPAQPAVAALINGAGFGAPQGGSLSSLVSGSKNTVGYLIDQYA